MIFTKFHENQLITDGEINEKHALLVSCGLRYIVSHHFRLGAFLSQFSTDFKKFSKDYFRVMNAATAVKFSSENIVQK